MCSAKLYLLFFFKTVLSLGQTDIDFSIDYFRERNVKFVCLLVCDNDRQTWDIAFTKTASSHSIAVSCVRTDVLFDDSYPLKMCLRQRYDSVGILIDANCPKFEEVLYIASENMYLDAMHKWLIIAEEDKTGKLTEDNQTEVNQMTSKFTVNNILENLNISVDTDIILSVNEAQGYVLYEVFNFGKVQGGNLITKEIGTWDVDTGLEIRSSFKEYKYYRRWDFQGCQLRMITVMTKPPKIFKPVMILGRKAYPGVPGIVRPAAMVFGVIGEMHNIKYTYKIVDRWIGDYHSNSSRMVTNSLYFREQDISHVLRAKLILFDKIDYILPPLSWIETKYFYRIPTTGAGKFENNFLKPLTAAAWGCVVAILAICSLILFMSARIEHRQSWTQYAVFSVIASMCQQSRKLTVLVTGVTCVLIYNYYTSSLVSWLLNGPPPSINSLEELMDSPLELIYEDIGYTKNWLQTPDYYYNKRNAKVEDEIRKKKVFNKKNGSLLLMTAEKGIELVKSGGYAFHTETATVSVLISRSFTQSELCELGYLQSMEKSALYPCLQKNSPYREFFVWSLIRLVERGIRSCLLQRTRRELVACEGRTPRALNLGGAAPVFILLVCGYVLGFIIMVIERIVKKWK